MDSWGPVKLQAIDKQTRAAMVETMASPISRRRFVESALLASAAVPLTLNAQGDSSPATTALGGATAASKEALPHGKIGHQEFSRLMMGGNLIAGCSHSRDLNYVSTLMRRYNTPAKIRETLELGEHHGITAINTYVLDDNQQIFDHWKCGGKMKWVAQARMDGGGGFSQIQKAIDDGASAIHLTADAAEGLLDQGKLDKIAEAMQFIKAQKRVAGVAGHDLRALVACEKAKVDVDFYQKTFHSHDYFSAQRPEDPGPVGANDNSWCKDPQAVVDFMATVKKPWVAFKVLAAGALQPRAAFPYAFNSGADFILVGMFDWQIEEDAKLANRVLAVVAGPNSKRTRPWCG
jgi:hypothetical protein